MEIFATVIDEAQRTETGWGFATRLKVLEAPYKQAVGGENGPDGPATSFSNIHAELASAFLADKPLHHCVTVTFGAACRVSVYDTGGHTVPLPPEYGWLYGWSAKPEFCPDGTLVLSSWSVQDIGNRTAYRVDLLKPTGTGYQCTKKWVRINTLDFGRPDVNRDKLVLTSIDLPVSYITTAQDTQFGRQEVYHIKDSVPVLLWRVLRQPVLRYLDRWMELARSSASPTALQSRFRKWSPKPDVLDSMSTHIRSKGVSKVTYAFNDGPITLGVKKAGRSYRVVSVEHGRH